MSASELPTRASFLVDVGGAIVTWNQDCELLFGIGPVGILQRSLGTLFAGDSADQLAVLWPALDGRPEALHLAVQLARPAGANDPPAAALMLAPQRDLGGGFTGCIATVSIEEDASESGFLGRLNLRKVMNVLPGTFYVVREDGSFVLWNKTFEEVTGLSDEQMAAAHALDMYDLSEKNKISEKIRLVFERGEPAFVEATLHDREGHGTPYLLTGARIECKGKYYLCGMGLDISVRHQQEQQLRLRERALHAASNGIVITCCGGKDNPIEYVNPAFERITGYRLHEVLGRDARFMAAPRLDQDARAALRRAIDQRHEVNVTFRNQRKNGELFWNDLTITPVSNEGGRVTHFIGVINDVTAIKQRTDHLEHEVHHDALTGLANRTLLWDRLDQAIHMAQRNKSLVATVLMDLDGFKQINDSFGHEAGDEVLTVVAQRLVASVRDSDTVARLSGDEFVLVLVNQPSLRFTLRMVERLRQSMDKPVVFNAATIDVGASIGVSVYPHDGNSAYDLVRAADVAMYHAKAAREGAVHFFSSDMKSTSEAKQRLEVAMHGAVERDELFLLFQPKVCLQSGRIRGFEALLRWRHPEQGVLLPGAFLPEAEENGMIVPFGDLVLERACAFLRRLRDAGLAPLPLSVNVSQREYARPRYVEHVAGVLARFGLAPATLDLELREEGLVRNHQLGAEVMAQLSELGVLRSIDAFGSGVSDLNYLQTLPLTHVKLAKLAVHQISAETRTGPMVKSLIDIGHNLNVTVVAECVETRAQMDFLKNNRCDEMQGMYYRAPLTAEAAQELLMPAVSA
jgi:diguanylate cyclase (GGDEF)-like protein/PAS domain S-box-containing protein